MEKVSIVPAHLQDEFPEMGFDAARKLPGEGFKREWPPLIKMTDAVPRKMQQLFPATGQ
jgi:3-polyprenyl-4-hydroxybenzoate decarboxylase